MHFQGLNPRAKCPHVPAAQAMVARLNSQHFDHHPNTAAFSEQAECTKINGI